MSRSAEEGPLVYLEAPKLLVGVLLAIFIQSFTSVNLIKFDSEFIIFVSLL